MNNNLREIYQSKIKNILFLFNKLTTKNILFIDTNLYLISSQSVSTQIKKVEAKLSKKKFILFFPLLINEHFKGFFLLNNEENNSTQIITLYKETLEKIVINIFRNYYQHIYLLSPISFKRMTNFLTMLQSIKNMFIGISVSTPNKFSNNKLDIKAGINDLQTALTYIEKHINQKLTLVNVAESSYLSSAYLSRLFKLYFKINFSKYIRIRKIVRAQKLLIATNDPINKISQKIGFNRASYFNKVFKENVHLTPLQFRKKYKATQKIYTIPRRIEWDEKISVYAISQNFFKKRNIDVDAVNVKGSPYIISIDGLSSLSNKNGWVYLVDGVQPKIPAIKNFISNKSVIQWFYLKL